MDEKEHSIASRNAKAEKMYKEGGVWQVEKYNGEMIDVKIIGIFQNDLGIKVLVVMALEGKPWKEKVEVGRRTVRRATNIANRRPEFLFRKENHDTCEN